MSKHDEFVGSVKDAAKAIKNDHLFFALMATVAPEGEAMADSYEIDMTSNMTVDEALEVLASAINQLEKQRETIDRSALDKLGMLQ